MITPLVCGFFMINMVYKLGFIDEDEGKTGELLQSQITDNDMVRFRMGDSSSFFKSQKIGSEIFNEGPT